MFFPKSLESFVAVCMSINLPSKAKTTVTFYQIATKVGMLYLVDLPENVRSFLSAVELGISFNLDAFATPLECLGVGGYVSNLQFWMMIPVIACGCVVLASPPVTGSNSRCAAATALR